MRRKRRRIQYYSGERTGARVQNKAWLPYAIVVVAAIVVALIVGTVLGSMAEASEKNKAPFRNLLDFGGVEQPQVKYADLPAVQADWIDLFGKNSEALRDALDAVEERNAVVFTAYDGNGGVNFDTALSEKAAVSLVEKAGVSAAEIVNRADAEDLSSVALFHVGALSEVDEQIRLIKISQELSLIWELCEAGVSEIFLVGLPTDSDDLEAVNNYIRQAFSQSGATRIGVAISSEDAVNGGISRLVSATEAFADSYALDLRSAQEASTIIEKNAYFLTAYHMRLILKAEENLPTVISQYGIESYLLAR